MKALLFSAMLLAGVNACVSDGLLRTDLDEAEREKFVGKLAAQKERFQKELRPQRAPVLAKTATKPHLWRLTDGQNTAFLLGTIHVEIAWSSFPFALRDCVSKAQAVVFEVGDDDRSGQVFADGLDRQIAAKTPTIKAAGEPALGNYKAELALVRPEILESLPPSAALGLYLTVTDQMVRGLSACMDCEIHEDAAQQKKRLGHLEDARDRGPALEMLLASSKKYTLDDFRRDFAKDPFAVYLAWVKDLYVSAAGYKTGNDATMVKALLVNSAEYDDLIGKRNRLWAPRITKMMREAPTLFVVGTGHMMGPAALDKLLGKDGVTVTRVETCD